MRKKTLARNIIVIVTLMLCNVIAGGGSWMTSHLGSLTPSAALPARAQRLSDPVATEQGLVRGQVVGNAIAFRGIPYTAPPVGDLRWKPPQLHAPWEGVRNALEFGSACPQFTNSTSDITTGGEDCLTFNIWAPKDKEPSLRPVMFFIHGGGNIQGASSQPVYDGQALVEKGGVVVVTINYRLGPLGFLAHPLLSAEDVEHHSSGNYGLLDQIFALQWVRRNIRNFGGDPDNIMIFGESAGGLNVSCLVASPLGAGLFQRAIVESGGFLVNTRLRDAPDAPEAESAEEFGIRFAKEIGCDSAADPLACLRSKTPEQLLNTLRGGLLLERFIGGNIYGPSVDEYVLTDSPLEVMLAGQHNNVPVIIGTNRNEGLIFILGIPLSSEADYQAAVERLFSSFSAQVLERYPVSDYPSPRAAFDAILTDLAFICPARAASLVLASYQPRTFVYHFTHSVNTPSFVRDLGAFHGLELAFVFNNFGLIRPTPEEVSLSETMLTYWTDFARNEDPNSSGLPLWPAYTLDGDMHLNLDVPISPGSALRKEYCDFWFQLFGRGSARAYQP
jgi:para-nitrobenzyl esterase